MSQDIGVWIAALLTLAIFSFLYKDNPVYKVAEHLFLGIALGYGLALYHWENVKPKLIDPLFPAAGGQPNYWVLIPALLGLFVLLRMVPRLAWLSRFSFAVYIGGAVGIAVPTVIAGNLLPQLEEAMSPLSGTPFEMFSQAVVAISTLAVLFYFFYSLEHKGPLGKVSRLGVLCLMISFGAGFGNTVMARISLLIGRFTFLLNDWLKVG